MKSQTNGGVQPRILVCARQLPRVLREWRHRGDKPGPEADLSGVGRLARRATDTAGGEVTGDAGHLVGVVDLVDHHRSVSGSQIEGVWPSRMGAAGLVGPGLLPGDRPSLDPVLGLNSDMGVGAVDFPLHVGVDEIGPLVVLKQFSNSDHRLVPPRLPGPRNCRAVPPALLDAPSGAP
jgi:hypothetical protein